MAKWSLYLSKEKGHSTCQSIRAFIAAMEISHFDMSKQMGISTCQSNRTFVSVMAESAIVMVMVFVATKVKGSL